MTLTIDSVRECLEGTVPGVIATCSDDGTPNVAYLSQVEYVDGRHVALSFQFFNKTRQNILANASAELLVVHPVSAAMYRIRARYLRTESEGPLFERMKAKLAGIASHTGMAGVFKLRGADVYEVAGDRAVPAHARCREPPPRLEPAGRAASRAGTAEPRHRLRIAARSPAGRAGRRLRHRARDGADARCDARAAVHGGEPRLRRFGRRLGDRRRAGRDRRRRARRARRSASAT